MKNIISSTLFLFILLSTVIAQTNKNAPLSKQQKIADSIQFEKFRKENPESFLNNRLPVKLISGGYVVNGYTTGIQVTKNHIKDSVYHNFHPGMADTSTVTPFNDIKVTDKQISINLFSHLGLMGGKDYDSASITPADPEFEWSFKGKRMPFGDFFANEVAVKISINGKLLFDWRPINTFAKQVYKQSEKFNSHAGGMFTYEYGYAICDTNLNINDQLLIEIKNTKNNWMIDRYNITRVATTPTISIIISTDKKSLLTENSIDQKKTSVLTRLIKK